MAHFIGRRSITFSVMAVTGVLAALAVGVVPSAAVTRGDCKSTPNRDVFVGTAKSDSCHTDGGDDSLFGARGNDDLRGGAGRDEVQGGKDNDNVDGGAGNDKDSERTDRVEGVFGGPGDDIVRDNVGGDDRDRLYGNAGRDRVSAVDGDGNDLADGGENADECEVDRGDSVRRCQIVVVVP